jgi:hypothetical protein
VPLPLPPQQSSNIDQTSAPELKNCSPHHYYYEEDKQEDESIELPKALKEKIKPFFNFLIHFTNSDFIH